MKNPKAAAAYTKVNCKIQKNMHAAMEIWIDEDTARSDNCLPNLLKTLTNESQQKTSMTEDSKGH